jgi:NAD(P)-dependent dehydrogenase (short-subunit alcohol dehydrogenase family)
MPLDAPVVLISGCSTGLGLETALYLGERGFRVYAGVRKLANRDSILDAARRRHARLDVIQLDVTEADSIDTAIQTVLDDAGSLYGVVNNAGIALRGCVEDLSDAEIRLLFETNVIGTFAVTRRALPHLRAAGRGRIVTISSVGGRIATFGLAAYCASKFALEGFGETLALEVEPFGIKAILIEPGIINTSRWGINRGNAVGAMDPRSPYADMFRRHEAIADQAVARSRTRPSDVARTVHRALTVSDPAMRYVVGRPASAAILLRRYVPNRLFERLYFGRLMRGVVATRRGQSTP